MAIPNHISTSQDPTSARSRTAGQYASEVDRLDTYNRIVEQGTSAFVDLMLARLREIDVHPVPCIERPGADPTPPEEWLTKLIVQTIDEQMQSPDPEQFA